MPHGLGWFHQSVERARWSRRKLSPRTGARLTSLQNPQSQIFTFGYDALSRRTSLARTNGVTSTYGYDALSRLLSVLHRLGSSTLDGATYAVDAVGNRTSKRYQPSGPTTNYGYDSIYQLFNATQGSSTTESYSYDSVGNRLSSLQASYTYNSSNEIASASNASYAYDNNGNVLSKTDVTGTTSYTWDAENRLTQVTLPGTGGSVTFQYDPFGRRIYKSSLNGTNIFAYDGANIVEEVDAAGTLVARYTQGPGIDEPKAMLRGANTSYYQQDGLGTVTSLSGVSGSLAQTYVFDSFGQQTASSGSLTNPFRYTGREFDPETGLYYYRARYYDPTIGRFISEDPAGFEGGFNFYRYVENDPIDSTDPTGLKTYECTAPLHAAPKLYNKVPLMYHEYLCVVGKDGKPVCVGQDREGSAFWSKGKPSDDNMSRGKCEQKEPDNQCIEQCILAEGAKPRPRYGIGPQGTDCQEWADDTLNKCQKQCKKK